MCYMNRIAQTLQVRLMAMKRMFVPMVVWNYSKDIILACSLRRRTHI
jgi:hypothetical protein